MTVVLETVETQTRTGRRPYTSGLMRFFLNLGDRFLHFVGPRYPMFIWLIVHTPPPVMAALGRLRAERTAAAAFRRVPAYQALQADGDGASVRVGRFELSPTDKSSYIDPNPLEARCWDGRLPTTGVTIDESSGSSGTPYNWVRSQEERQATHVFISHFIRFLYGDEPLITLNAFSMGAWATGINMGAALERNSVVKNTGPDVDKVFSTLDYLGTDRRYLICGYPPFLKHLIDTAKERDFPLEKYRLVGLVGGEGMSEGLRDYLIPTFDQVFSGYGATDVEIGMAGETPFSVSVRRLAAENPALRRRLFGADSRLPMVFHYNPLQHHVTVNDAGELIFTITRMEVVAPRVGYNIRDKGGVMPYADICGVLREFGYDPESLWQGYPVIPLPMLWVHGRSDYTVSVMGANIYPEDLETALYRSSELSAMTRGFCLGSEEQSDGTILPVFSFELNVEPTEAIRARFERRIVDSVIEINSDFRVAAGEHWDSVAPIVQIYSQGEGPFAGDSDKIKQTRMT